MSEILEEKESKKGSERGFRLEVMESTNGFCHVSLRLPIDEANALFRALRKKRTRKALCEAAKSTGLDKALPGSWYCITCMGGHMSRHNVNEKAWFDAFLEGFGKCDGPCFSVSSGRCPGT